MELSGWMGLFEKASVFDFPTCGYQPESLDPD